MLATWKRLNRPDTGSARERLRLEWRKKRMTSVYLDGDMSQADYRAERDRIDAELAALPTGVEGTPPVAA